MARWVPDEKAEFRSVTRLRREQRRLARELARRHIAEFLTPLQTAPPPEWFTEEQAYAYAVELRRLRERLAPRVCARVHAGAASE